MFRKYLTALVIFFISYGHSVPIDYCFHPLNKDDCNLKPTPVFSYYKSGSRCEIEIWRGCPTFNMFPNEFVCSHHCIGKLWDREIDNKLDFEPMPFEDECSVPINISDCGIIGQFKYTYKGSMCTRVEWKGCMSQNVFDDEETCLSTCNQYYLKNQLENLPQSDAEAINDILNRAVANNDSLIDKHPIQQLKQKMKTEPKDEITNTTTPVSTTAETVVETKSEIAETTKKTVETTSKAVEATSETIKTTSEIVETKNDIIKTTSEAVEITSEAVETTSEAVQTSSAIETTVETTEEVTTVAPIPDTTEARETTTMGEGSAEEVVLT